MKKIVNLICAPLFLQLTATAVMAQTIEIKQPGTIPATNIGNVISAVVGILLVLAAILAFLFLILGGIQWITSGGDKAGMEAARNKITAAIVGLIIVAAAWAIMLLVGQFIGFDLLGGSIDLPTIQDPTRGG